jgi:hypothetical protein
LRAVGGELRLKAVEHFLGQPTWIGRRLHHQRRHGADDRSFCHAAFAMTGNVVHDFAAGGMADMHRILQVQARGQRREVVGIVIHVMAAPDLTRAAVAAPVMCDDAEAVTLEEKHLCIPVIGRKRLAMAEDNRLTRAPVLVVDLCAVLGGDRAHPVDPLACSGDT